MLVQWLFHESLFYNEPLFYKLTGDQVSLWKEGQNSIANPLELLLFYIKWANLLLWNDQVYFLLYNGSLFRFQTHYMECLAQDCSNSSALALELLQSCAKLSTYYFEFFSTAIFSKWFTFYVAELTHKLRSTHRA